MNTQDQQPAAPDPAWVPPPPTAAPAPQQSDPVERGVPKRAKIALGVLGGLVLVAGFGAVVSNGKDGAARADAGPTVTATVTASPAPAPAAVTATVTATVTVTVTQTAAVAAEPPAEAAAAPPPGGTIAGDGTFLVGDDIEPGTYKTAGPGRLGMCYWERAKDSSGDFESIITNETLTGQGVVTIKKTDKVFKTQG